MSTIIVLEGGEIMRLKRNGNGDKAVSKSAQTIVTASPEISKHLIHTTGGAKPRSPLSSPVVQVVLEKAATYTSPARPQTARGRGLRNEQENLKQALEVICHRLQNFL